MDQSQKVRSWTVSALMGALFPLVSSCPEPTQASSIKGLEVQVEGIKKAPGEIGVVIFSNKLGYPFHLEHAEELQWIKLENVQDSVVANFDSLPVGDYAVAVFHDENGNRRIDRNAWGFPREGVGFSKGQMVNLRSPSFKDAKFTFTPEESLKVTIQIDYEAGLNPGETVEEVAEHLQEIVSEGLVVRVEGIQKRQGEVGVALFNGKIGFPTRFEHVYEAEWVRLKNGQNSIEVVFDSIPMGEYAVSVLHDENNNRKMDRTPLGFPAEGVGFSNDQKVTLKAPSFHNCKFAFRTGESKKVLINIDY